MMEQEHTWISVFLKYIYIYCYRFFCMLTSAPCVNVVQMGVASLVSGVWRKSEASPVSDHEAPALN